MPKTKIEIEWKVFAFAAFMMLIAGIALAPKETEPCMSCAPFPEDIVDVQVSDKIVPLETVEQIIQHVGTELKLTQKEIDRFVKIAWCESRNDPKAISSTDDHGLFQINAWYWDFDWTRIYDAEYNTLYAMEVVYQTQGFGAWVCTGL